MWSVIFHRIGDITPKVENVYLCWTKDEAVEHALVVAVAEGFFGPDDGRAALDARRTLLHDGSLTPADQCGVRDESLARPTKEFLDASGYLPCVTIHETVRCRTTPAAGRRSR